MHTLKAIFKVLLLLAMIFSMTLITAAQEEPKASPAVLTTEKWQLVDANRTTKLHFEKDERISFSGDQYSHKLYLVWDVYPKGGWRLNGKLQDSGFIHEFVELEEPVKDFEIVVGNQAVLCDVYGFSEGTVPSFVQHWNPPVAKADILLLPTHGDDELIFFGGILPTYAPNPEYSVQVAYMVNHNTEPYRSHEILDGLYCVGLRNYPIIPHFPDIYSMSLNHARSVYNQQEIIEYQTELIMRFNPQVIIGHDLNGEYGHGAHRLNADSLTKSILIAKEKGWETKKVYLHLYKTNPIVLNYGTPLPFHNQKTAFTMACEGFDKHVSQKKFFKVEQSGAYDCRKFGLYYTAVGPDTKKRNDIMEHITTYSAQQRQEEWEEQEQEQGKASESKEIERQNQQEADDSLLRQREEKWDDIVNNGLAAIGILIVITVIFITRRR